MIAALVAALGAATAQPARPVPMTARPPAGLPVPRVVRPAVRRPACEVAPSPPGLQLMVLGHYEHASLSTAWVGSADNETGVATVTVASGPPLHLVVTGHGQNIYRFTGATGRIRRLTLMGTNPMAAIGIPRARIEFAGRCLDYSLFQADDDPRGQAAVRDLYGRDAVIAGAYAILDVRIGRGIAISQPARQARPTRDPETDELLRFSPGGIVRVDYRTLVSDAPVGAYLTWPQQAGLRQLLQTGALVRATEADARRWEERARRSGAERPRAIYGYSYGAYRVTRPITVPAGLCGAHSVTFYVPSPDFIRGDPCHSTLYYDDGTGSGPLLRR